MEHLNRSISSPIWDKTFHILFIFQFIGHVLSSVHFPLSHTFHQQRFSKCFTDIFSYYFAHWLIAYVYIYIQTWICKIVQMCSSILRLKQRVFIHAFGMHSFTWFSVFFFIGSIFVYFHSKIILHANKYL